MSDYNSGLPVRTEADGTDERLHVKVVDGATPAQRMTVDTDGNAHAEMHGNDPTGTDRVVRTSELGAITPDGFYHATNNTKPGSSGLIGHTRTATPADTDQVKRLTAVTSGTTTALDIAVRDSSGAAITTSNPLPVFTVENGGGTSVDDYKTAPAVAAAGTDNHDYTVTAAKTLHLMQIEAAASGKAKMEVRIETAAGSGTFNTKFVKFNSTAEPNMSLILANPILVATGVKVRVIMTNKDNQAQDLYSTISGYEV